MSELKYYFDIQRIIGLFEGCLHNAIIVKDANRRESNITSFILFILFANRIHYISSWGGAKKEEDENCIFHFNIRHFVHSNALVKMFC